MGEHEIGVYERQGMFSEMRVTLHDSDELFLINFQMVPHIPEQILVVVFFLFIIIGEKPSVIEIIKNCFHGTY